LIIKNNCDLVKFKGEYFVHLTIPYEIKKECKDIKFCGIDPGIRTFLSIYGNNEISDISFKKECLNNLNAKINFLKSNRIKPLNKNQKNKYRKNKINKVEKKKKSIIDALHWNVINYLVKTQDVIFFGDIKSHNIVKRGKNKSNNRDFNDLKFFQFKQRLMYKCISNNKKLFLINEAYTSQGCSSCGNLWKEIGSSKKYICQNTSCRTKDMIFDRDFNAAKNICMKGLMSVF
jgi:IS605 OrfB family transposase